jgi:hypothetical protein
MGTLATEFELIVLGQKHYIIRRAQTVLESTRFWRNTPKKVNAGLRVTL